MQKAHVQLCGAHQMAKVAYKTHVLKQLTEHIPLMLQF